MLILLTLCWLVFWIYIGKTEGFKWTTTPKIVTAANYHILRTNTTASVLGIAMFSGIGFVHLSVFQMALFTIYANLATWPLYEMALNWVNWGKFFPNKGQYVFGSVSFHHPPPQLVLCLSPLGWVLVFLFIK